MSDRDQERKEKLKLNKDVLVDQMLDMQETITLMTDQLHAATQGGAVGGDPGGGDPTIARLTTVLTVALSQANKTAFDRLEAMQRDNNHALVDAIQNLHVQPQVTVQAPNHNNQGGGGQGGAFKYKHMQDVKLLNIDSMSAADFKSWEKTWDDYYKVNQLENCAADIRMAAFRLLCTENTRDKILEMTPPDDRENDPA